MADNREEQVKKLAQELSNVVNEFERTGVKILIEEMSQDHRTLQQGYTRFALEWLYHLSQLPEGHYDLRNQASVEIAKKIDKAVDLKYARQLPLI